MVSNFKEYYILSKYVSQYFTRKRVGIVLGMPNLIEILDEEQYKPLPGGILEALSRLFNSQTKMFVYPMIDQEGNIQKVDNIKLPEHLQPLFEYLKINKKVVDLSSFNPELLGIYSENVLRMLQNNNPEWEKYVPVYVANNIKTKKIFGFRDESPSSVS
jgi:hypothetical protein